MPNAISTVEGEASLFDKLHPYLANAELWLIDNVIGRANLLPELCNESQLIDMLCKSIVAHHALLRAVPALDLVLTPNGFGIVSNSNVVPASKERIERLILSLEQTRDEEVQKLVYRLATVESWNYTALAQHFAGSLQPNIFFVKKLGFTEHVWDKFIEYHDKAVDVEDSLAEEYFSPELIRFWRREMFLQHALSIEANAIISAINEQVIEVLKGGSINHRRMVAAVNVIRNNPDDFPQWHASETAKLFSPPVFKNKKRSNGFWF